MQVLLESPGRVLVVDDEQPVRRLLRSFLAKRGYVAADAGNGADALATLDRERFDLVLSDLRMPGMDGMALLAEIRRRFPDVAVLMLTGCEDVSVAVDAMKAGALDYLLKPFQLERVEQAVDGALRRHHESRAEMERVRTLEETVARQTVQLRHHLAHLEDASAGTLDALVAALDAREHETQSHSRRVSEYTMVLARALKLTTGELEVIYQGAMLHDIGKIGVSDNILLKPGRLTAEEWVEMRRHPQVGYWILHGIERLRPAAALVLSHHERVDGFGYPLGIGNGKIPLGSRIFSIVDTLDAITSDRPYRESRSFEFARQEICANAGTQFDADIVARFLDVDPALWLEIRSRTLGETGGTATNLPRLVLDECRLNSF